MSTIKELSLEELDEFIRIDTNAYPGVVNHSPDIQQKLRQQFRNTQLHDPNTDYYGLYRNDKLLGGMRLHHYKMNYSSSLIDVGGVGSVAVDLLHKKEGVAKELIEYFISYFQERQFPLVALYPFRLDFYKKMGFGFGTKMNQYKIKPIGIRRTVAQKKVQYVTEVHKKLLLDCYNRFALTQHGMMLRTEFEVESLFKNPNVLYAGYIKDDQLQGYLSFSFKKESDTNFTFNDIHVKELVYETNDAREQLYSFLHSQLDQVNRVVVNTQDEFFHLPLMDPTNGTNHLIPSVYHETNTSGLGIMYRVIDVPGFFRALENHNFNNSSCKVKFFVKDNFLNDHSTIVHFDKGYPKVMEDADFDVEVTLDISDFSSLVMGVVDAKSLYQHGLLQISNLNDLRSITHLFLTDGKPICMTAF